MRTVAPTHPQTFDAFGEPIAALAVAERVGSARLAGIAAFWMVAALLVAGRFFVPVPQFDQALAPATAGATTLASAESPTAR